MSLFNRLTAFSTLSGRAVALVWATSRPLFCGLIVATLIAGILPALAAWIGQRIVDAVVQAMQIHGSGSQAPVWPVLRYVLAEAGVLALLAAAQRALSMQQALLRVQLGQKVNLMILQKAQTLSLLQFEDSAFYDKLVRAPRCIDPATGPRHKRSGAYANRGRIYFPGHINPYPYLIFGGGAIGILNARIYSSGLTKDPTCYTMEGDEWNS